MTGHSHARPSTLTATDWELILAALDAYQHHAAYRDLHGKVARLAQAAGVPSPDAVTLAAAVSHAGGARSLDRPALLG